MMIRQTALILVVGLVSCRGPAPADTAAIMGDMVANASTGSVTASEAHPVCLERIDLLPFITTSDIGSDRYKAAEAQQQALMSQGRCTFLGRGARFDVNADGQEVYHTPHGTLAVYAIH